MRFNLLSGFCAALFVVPAFAGHVEQQQQQPKQQQQQQQAQETQQTQAQTQAQATPDLTQEQRSQMPGMLVVRVKKGAKGQETEPTIIPVEQGQSQSVSDSSSAQALNQQVEGAQSFPVQDCAQDSSCAQAPAPVQQAFHSQQSTANATAAPQATWARRFGGWNYWSPYRGNCGFYGYGRYPYYGYGYGSYNSYYPYNYSYNPYLYANYGVYYGSYLYPYSYAGYYYPYGGYNYYYYYNPYYY